MLQRRWREARLTALFAVGLALFSYPLLAVVLTDLRCHVAAWPCDLLYIYVAWLLLIVALAYASESLRRPKTEP